MFLNGQIWTQSQIFVKSLYHPLRNVWLVACQCSKCHFLIDSILQQPQLTTAASKDKKSSQKLLKMADKKVSSSTSSLKQSKNAKGTSSSVACSTTTVAVTSKQRPQIFKNSKNMLLPPSPYSVPTAPKLPFKSTASTASSGSGYDSGHDSGMSKDQRSQ